MLGVLAVLLLGDAVPSVGGEVERWIGPVLTSGLSLAATYFTYLSARDKLIYDSERKLEVAELIRLRADSVKAEKMREAQELQIKALQLQVSTLEARVDPGFRRPKKKPPASPDDSGEGEHQ